MGITLAPDFRGQLDAALNPGVNTGFEPAYSARPERDGFRKFAIGHFLVDAGARDTGAGLHLGAPQNDLWALDCYGHVALSVRYPGTPGNMDIFELVVARELTLNLTKNLAGYPATPFPLR